MFLIRPFFLLVFFSLWGSSCVYFNVFYNAEKHFNAARSQQQARLKAAPDSTAKITDSEKSAFDKSIEKCSKVLDQYPQNKKYVAKATLLLGEIYYWKTEYLSAIRKFNEFLSHYPEHPDFYRAVYYKGLCYFEQRDFEKAEKEFEKSAESSPSSDIKTRSRYMLSEISVFRGSSFGAIDQLKKLEGGGKALQSLIHYKMGLLLFKQKDYKEAYKHFVAVEPVKKSEVFSEITLPENIKYESEMLAGICLNKGGEPGKALDHFEKMLQNDSFFKFFGAIYNQIAECEVALGKHEEAKKYYLKVIAEYPKTRESAAAYYRLGLLYESVWNNVREAFNCYKNSQTEFSGSEEAVLAKDRYTSLRAIRLLSSNLDSLMKTDTGLTKEDTSAIDSVKKMRPEEKYFRVAEIYLYRLSSGDSALLQYQKVMALDTSGDSTGLLKKSRMKSLYAMAWINENVLSNKLTADSLYRLVVQNFPATDYAKASGSALGGPDTILTHSDSVSRDYMAAESLYYGTGDCKGAIAAFNRFAAKWPAEKMTPKAYLASAWISENCLFDNSSADTLYRLLVKTYGETDFGRFARRKMEGKKENLQEIFVEKPGEGPEGTVLNEKVAQKMETMNAAQAKESADEDAWVTIKSLTATNGKMEGKRADAVIRKELKPAVEAIEEVYINMVDEGLKQEGELTVRFTVKETGEVTRVKSDKAPEGLNDKTLLEEVENTLTGMEFEETKGDVSFELHFTFKRKAVQHTDDL